MYQGASYPQKYITSLATRYASGNQLFPHEFNAGQSLPILEAMGFTIEATATDEVDSTERTHINGELIGELYYFAKELHEGRISREDAFSSLQVKPATAGAYFDDFQQMREGDVYQRTMNAEATEYFLVHIHKDYGVAGLRLALQAVDKHVRYYDSLDKGHQRGIRALWEKYFVIAEDNDESLYLDEIGTQGEHVEGGKSAAMRSFYKRNPRARTDCLAHHGYSCSVCTFDFERTYGKIGRRFIHVHHVNDIALNGDVKYVIDAINDLKPVCPNCHAMLHRETPALSVEKLRQIMMEKKLC
jgi:5-methylcytosine-specific restriction protein A